MVDTAHSPAPFRRLPRLADGGHIIVDALGDSIGALAHRTGDHTPEEQLANAILFEASPKMLAALNALNAVRPVNWDDEDEDPDQAQAWRLLDEALASVGGAS